VAHLFVAPVLPTFLLAHSEVRLDLDLTNRRVDLIGEGYDVASRIRSALEDSDLVIRQLGRSDQVLVAAPSFIAAQGPVEKPEDLNGVRGLGPAGVRGERPRWSLLSPAGTPLEIDYQPCLATDDVYLMSRLAVAGVGVAQLPFHVCEDDIHQGRLADLLPGHRPPAHQLHAVYPTRRGMVPAVKAFVDLLATEIPQAMARANRDFIGAVGREAG
jgi:DNA-binding transcriptional LysR family regulator